MLLSCRIVNAKHAKVDYNEKVQAAETLICDCDDGRTLSALNEDPLVFHSSDSPPPNKGVLTPQLCAADGCQEYGGFDIQNLCVCIPILSSEYELMRPFRPRLLLSSGPSCLAGAAF